MYTGINLSDLNELVLDNQLTTEWLITSVVLLWFFYLEEKGLYVLAN